MTLTQKDTFAKGSALVAVVLVGVWAAGCAGGSSSSSPYQLSITRIKSLDLGILQYSNDYDEVLPLAGKWMDGVTPYTKDEALFHSPAVGTKGYGYAFNALVAGQVLTQFSSPETTESLFDSTDLSRNATDFTSTEPSPPRYGSRNTIAYLDGHVQDQNTGSGVAGEYKQSQSNLKAVDLGMLMYSNDYDGALPLANQWIDELTPYVRNSTEFQSPAILSKDPNGYGYAYNAGIVGQIATNIASPATTLSFFDSTVLTRNATTLTTTLPSPPRYGKVNTLAYVDGHVHP